MKKVSHGSLGASISARSSMATEFLRKLEQQKCQDAALAKQLLAAAPIRIREWLVEDLVVGNLFEYGRASRKIVFRQAPPFGDLKHIQFVMGKLKEAWAGVVEVKIDDDPEPHRVEIHFKVVF